MGSLQPDGAGAVSSVELRPVEPGDEEFLLRVYASTRAEELALVDWDDGAKEAFLRMQFSAQDRWYRDQMPDASYQIVLVDGDPAGRLYLDRRENEIRIVDITLLPEYRRKGVGTALIRDVVAEAVAIGKPVTIHVERFNPALRLYQQLGFAEVEDRGVYLLLERPARVAT